MKHLIRLMIWACAPLALAANVENSVVKIVNQQTRFSWFAPWSSGSTGYGTGSGFVIDGNRIMTNAHVVSDSAILLVYFHNDPTPYPAKVKVIGHDCDLAIVELNDPTRSASIPSLSFSEGLPALRSKVETYGYPAGGQRIASTAGVVSRIEFNQFAHSRVDYHLTVQTDAAINPGNSGGPVMRGDKIIGVAFQGNSQLENMGFFIPLYVVNHFLRDLEDGTYHGYPELGITDTSLENPAARRYAKMPDGMSGIRVEHLTAGCSAADILRVDDIITACEGYDIANDGTIDWNGMRLTYAVLSEGFQVGEKVRFSVWRDGQLIELEIPLLDYTPTGMQKQQYDIHPQYFVYAGWVFVPVNLDTVSTFSKSWVNSAPQELIYQLYFRSYAEGTRADEPQVMVIRRLDDAVNVEEGLNKYHLIDTINGQTVRTISEVITAIESNENPQHVVRFQYGDRLSVLDRAAADEANPRILKNYAIPKDRQL